MIRSSLAAVLVVTFLAPPAAAGAYAPVPDGVGVDTAIQGAAIQDTVGVDIPGTGLPTAETAARELPSRAVIQTLVRREGGALRMLVRVPLDVMRHVELPLEEPGYLVLDQVDPYLEEAGRVWIEEHVRLYAGRTPLEGGRVTAARISLPSNRSFDTYERALSHLAAPPLPATTQLFWRQGLLDFLVEYPVPEGAGNFGIRPGWADLAAQTIGDLTIVSPHGTVRQVRFSGDAGLIRFDPGILQVAAQFVGRGFVHMLGGIEALLFLLLLVVPFRRVVPAAAIVASFATGHTITLVAAAIGITPSALWFPPLIATLVAVSIVYVGFENIIGAEFSRRWPAAFIFGLAHGFASWFPLQEALPFAGAHVAPSLAAFNVGIVLAGLLAVVAIVPLLEIFFRRVVAEGIGTILLSALVAHSAWHWMLDRGGALWEYQFQLPLLDLAFVAGAMRWLTLMLIAVGTAWLLFGLFARIPEGKHERDRTLPLSREVW